MERWQMLYPLYFNKSFTKEQGRVVSLEDAVENPDVDSIMEILKESKIEAVYECKRHPADYFNWGRIKYKVMDKN